MNKIKLQQYERDCPANTTMRNDGRPSRHLIRDFRVLIDGEHRAILTRNRYGGGGYELRDPDHRQITNGDKTNAHSDLPIKIASQAMFLTGLTKLLEAGRIPTLAQIETARAKDRADKVERKRHQRLNDIKDAKIDNAEALYDALLGVAKFYGWVGCGGKLNPTAERAVAVLKAADKLPEREGD